MYPVPLSGRAPWCGGSLWRRRRWRSRALGSRHPGSHRKPRWSAPRTPQAWSVKGQGRPLGQLARIEQHTISCWEETMGQGAAGENTSAAQDRLQREAGSKNCTGPYFGGLIVVWCQRRTGRLLLLSCQHFTKCLCTLHLKELYSKFAFWA